MDGTSDPTEFAAPEYLPGSKTHVDLLQPERMSQAALLELFSRRGFGTLVSPDDPFHRLIDLYYDHIMPIPPHDELVDNVKDTQNKPRNGTSENTNSSVRGPNSTKISPTVPLKRPPETRLEDLVITSDPHRVTPGFATPEENRAERVLTVRKPKGLVNGAPTSVNSNHPGTEKELCGTPQNTTESNSRPDETALDSASIPRKRVKLKRDFTSLV